MELITRKKRVVLHSLVLSLAMVVLVSMPGCSLIYIPYAVQYPHRQMRQISIRDAQTNAPVSKATVAYELHKWGNYILPPPHWGISNHGPEKDNTCCLEWPHFGQPCPAIAKWQATRKCDGFYTLEPHTRWNRYEFISPIPIALGCGIHHTHKGLLVIKAPGYKTLWVTDAPSFRYSRYPQGWFWGGEDPPDGARIEVQKSGIRVFLPPTKATTSKSLSLN